MYKIPLIKPFVDQEVKNLVLEVLDSGFLTEGRIAREFEEAIAAYTGARHVNVTTSATTGLELALRAAGIGHGDEVIVPDFTYPATADAVAIVGATAVIVDVSPETMLIDADAIEAAITSHTKALIPVSAFGNPCDFERLSTIKNKYGLILIEDAAPSIGAAYRGRKVGTLADMTVFSFHPRKFITTGEGGAIATDNSAWAEWINSYKHFGMKISGGTPAPEFIQIGTNSKMSDVLAAIGLGQMRNIDRLLARRIFLAERYKESLSRVEGIELPNTVVGGEPSYQSFCVFVDDRDRILMEMRAKGTEVQIGTYALHRQPAFHSGSNVRLCGPFDGSDYAYEHALALPLFHDMSEADLDTVVRELISSR